MSEPLQISVHVQEKRYQPTQEKTVVPGWDAKTVTPDKGYALSKVTVEGMPEPTESETFTENGTYDVGRIGTAIIDVDIDLQDKTVTPTEQTQTIEADAGYDGLDTVTVNPIPPGYVVPSGSVEITANGQVSVAGKATANVSVPQGVFPSGTKLITQNVTGEDVTNYAAVDVAVPGPSGTKQISITQNGTTTEDVSEYANAEITVNTLPAKGLVLDEWDSNGWPTRARTVGAWTTFDYYQLSLSPVQQLVLSDTITSINLYNSPLPAVVMPHNDISLSTNALRGMKNVTEFEFFGDVSTIPNLGRTGQFQACANLLRVIFGANIDYISNSCFSGNTKTVLYDFSHCTAIPPLYSVASLGHAVDCVIRIPAALSDTTLGEDNGWESATNWSALTDIVWEVV